MNKDFVTYKDFGAAGDGITDDFSAIVACHEYANKNGLPVIVSDGEYYLGADDMTAVIMTDTDFTGAKFIIDDRKVKDITRNCFHIKSDAEYFYPEITSLSKNQKIIDFPHSGNVYLRVFSDKKVYIRKGLNKNNGTDACDCILVDNVGNVCCGINWDYEKIKSAYAFSVDDKPVCVRGGIFVTIANEAESAYNYHERNILVTRSNVTIENIVHYVTGEGEHGAPYSGFLCVKDCCNITIKDCTLTPHMTYYTQSQIPGKMVPMGSYDLNCYGVIGLKLINIQQTVDICDSTYWGLMGSNFCKNVSVINCTMSRFDAHCGVTGGEIISCKLGHMGVHLIGFGDFLIENTTVFNKNFITFRDDFGANFNGNLTIRNCIWKPCSDKGCEYNVFFALNEGDHDFGYLCSMPENIEIDGLFIDDENIPEGHNIAVFGTFDDNFSDDKPYPYTVPKKVILNISCSTGKAPEICRKAELYEGMNVVYK